MRSTCPEIPVVIASAESRLLIGFCGRHVVECELARLRPEGASKRHSGVDGVSCSSDVLTCV